MTSHDLLIKVSTLIVTLPWDKSTAAPLDVIDSTVLPFVLSLLAVSVCKIRKFPSLSFGLIIPCRRLIEGQIEKKEKIIYILGG